MSARRRAAIACVAVAAACALALMLLPAAKGGLRALLNRLFEASEAANAYAYERLAVTDGANEALAAGLLAAIGVALVGLAALVKSRAFALVLAAALAGGQTYVGLSLPAWANIAAFALLGLCAMRPESVRQALAFLAGAAAVALLVGVVWPGVDAPTEAASERARDMLSRAAGQTESAFEETPESITETRHVNTRSLIAGDGESRRGNDYRLVTIEEKQIAMPHWVDYLRIVLLLLLTVAAVIVPFLPFVFLNARRRKAREARAAFDSEDAGEAVRAMFRHTSALLAATGCGAGNRPFRAWPDALNDKLPKSYVQRYAACVKLFEEAAYSDHPTDEAARARVRELLDETERLVLSRADWKEKLRLRYVECLCE